MDVPLELDLSGADPGDEIELGEQVARAMVADHRLRSPDCENGQVDGVKVPLSGTPTIQ